MAEALNLAEDGPKRRQFLHRLQSEIAKRGVIDALRKGVKHGPHSIALFNGAPSPGNRKAEEDFRANIFSVTRQLRYSRDEAQLALNLAIFINGLPVATFELKNRSTKQTVEDAVQQYKRARDPRELLFQFGRCVVHFALDDHEVRICSHLKGKDSWFLPFNKIRRVISDEIPAKVSADRAYHNAKKNSDRQNARIEHDKVLRQVVTDLFADHTELFRLFSDEPNFRKSLSEFVFWLTYELPADTRARDVGFMATRAALLVQKQFGVEAKWRQVNEAVWEYFAHHQGERIGLSEVKQIASAISVTEDDVFSVLGPLTGPDQDFIRRVYYCRAETGHEEEVASEEVIRQTRLWWVEKKISEEEWRRWAATVFVGWEPAAGDEKLLSN